MTFDPPGAFALEGVAAAELEGVVPADRYVPTRPFGARVPVAAIRRAPHADAMRVDELLFGEGFEVLATRDGFAFGQARRDGYVGWVEAAALGPAPPAPTHRVAALRTPVFAEADLKSSLRGMLSMNSLVVVGDRAERFIRLEGLGWAPVSHLAPVGAGFEVDPAGVAERFLGAPYLWGGRSSLGLDCSGLVQQALHACGRACPRDTGQQRGLGVKAPAGPPRRNDLVFWPGHVGIMLDGGRLLHANAHHMAVAVEPLDAACARIAATGAEGPIFRRL